MNLAKTAIERPIWVAVSVVLIFLLGLLSIRGLPVQLFPDIDRPHLNITVDWRSASPQEMESEITDPIEQEMQGVQGLKSIGSNSYPGFTEINMEFALGTDMQRAQLDAADLVHAAAGHAVAHHVRRAQVFDVEHRRDAEGHQQLVRARLEQRGLVRARDLPEMDLGLHHGLHDLLHDHRVLKDLLGGLAAIEGGKSAGRAYLSECSAHQGLSVCAGHGQQ